jgi:hypothetical protein
MCFSILLACRNEQNRSDMNGWLCSSAERKMERHYQSRQFAATRSFQFCRNRAMTNAKHNRRAMCWHGSARGQSGCPDIAVSCLRARNRTIWWLSRSGIIFRRKRTLFEIKQRQLRFIILNSRPCYWYEGNPFITACVRNDRRVHKTMDTIKNGDSSGSQRLEKEDDGEVDADKWEKDLVSSLEILTRLHWVDRLQVYSRITWL